ncbi:MAG: VWA domain-containing protein, partial [Bradymonadales bacterium]
FIQFQLPQQVYWMVLALALLMLLLFLGLHQRDRLAEFISPEMQRRLVVRKSGLRYILRYVFIALFFFFGILALMRPYTVKSEAIPANKKTANVYILLDVSKSMLATDTAPNRLERAKAEIRDMLPTLVEHRVGLAAFAGRLSVLSPLTVDQGFLRLALDNASIHSVTLGGTRIGDALARSVDMLAEQEGPKAILLISDGEDHDSDPLEAARAARKAGVSIIAVGFGSETGSTLDVIDPKTGAKTRIVDSAGKDVISRLDGKTLREIALETNGVYIPASTGVLDLESIMKKHVLPLVDDPDVEDTRIVKVELFQWFLLCAIFALLALAVVESRVFMRSTKEQTQE